MAHSPHINPKGVPLLDVGRDVQGRFTKANKGGPGNPFARKCALRKALLDSVSEQDVKDVALLLKLRAQRGDLAAIKLFLQYCVGKPEAAKDPDRMDADEWQRLQEMRVAQEQFDRTIEDFPASLACHQAQTFWPCMAQEGPLAQTIHDVHEQLQAGGQPSTAPGGRPSKNTTPDGAPRPGAAPAQPSAAAASQTRGSKAQGEPTLPPAAKGELKSSDRREPAAAGRSRRDSHSPTTRPPSPNGGIGEEQRQAPERPQRPRQPSGQTQHEPPPR